MSEIIDTSASKLSESGTSCNVDKYEVANYEGCFKENSATDNRTPLCDNLENYSEQLCKTVADNEDGLNYN